MAEGAPIFITGPGELEPQELELTMALVRELRAAIRVGVVPGQPADSAATVILNALISIYLDTALSIFGFEATDKSLRLIRRDLPRMMAALRAAKAQTPADQGGRA